MGTETLVDDGVSHNNLQTAMNVIQWLNAKDNLKGNYWLWDDGRPILWDNGQPIPIEGSYHPAPALPYLEVEPEIVFMYNWGGEYEEDVRSNTTWRARVGKEEEN